MDVRQPLLPVVAPADSGSAVIDSSPPDLLPPRTRPLHVIAAIATATAIVWTAGQPLNDFDAPWHVELGRLIVRAHSIMHPDIWWMGVPDPHGWVTSQWLAEVMMYLLTAAGGWHAIVAARLITLVVLVGLLWRNLISGREPYLALPVFLITMWITTGDVQDRPQTAGLVFLAWLGPVAARLLFAGSRPPVPLVAAYCLVWAQLHGTWILAPIAFLLLAGCALLNREARTAGRVRTALVCFAASLSGLVNPHGFASFILPLRFDAASHLITEWGPTTFNTTLTVVWGLLVAMALVACARTPGRTAAGTLLWVLFWAAFGMRSFRNVAPSALLIAPFALKCLEDWYASWQPGGRAPGSARTGPRESQILAAFCVVLLAGSTLVSAVRIPSIDTLARVPARRTAEWIAAQPGQVRVFNDWNANGALIAMSDRKARLVEDARNDLWGGPYLQRIDDVEQMQPGWQRTLSQFRPDAVVLYSKSPLVSGLTMQGWHVAVRERYFVLMVPH